jgi:hypothetical protein
MKYNTQDVIAFNLETILSGHLTFMDDEETAYVRGTGYSYKVFIQ